MKAYLELDMPDSCNDCALLRDAVGSEVWCMVGGWKAQLAIRPHDCPLKQKEE